MALNGAPDLSIVIVPAHGLSSQEWWEALHTTINTSFKNKDFAAYPPSWSRLPEDSTLAAQNLAKELGPNGFIAVAFALGSPIACAGVTPFRGNNWIDEVNEIKSAGDGRAEHPAVSDCKAPSERDRPECEAWELCCVCVHPQHRGTGLSTRLIRAVEDSIKPRGAKRLCSVYVTEETGKYWPHLGFETVPGAGGVLKKGFVVHPGLPGLLADIHFAMGWKSL